MDLSERTLAFAESVITLCVATRKDMISSPMITQIVRSSTSVGANYREAQAAVSRKDFRNKIYICKKELFETIYWLRLITKYLNMKNYEPVVKECEELIKIFQSITKKLDKQIALNTNT